MNKNKIKPIIDILMLLLILVIIYLGFSSWDLSQWLSVGVLILLIIHMILNWEQMKDLFRKKETPPIQMPPLNGKKI